MKLTEKQGNLILGVAGIIGGLIILFLTYIQKLEFVRRGMPGSGMFPILCGIGVSACGGLLIFEVLKNKGADEEENLINEKEIRNLLFFTGLGCMILVLTDFIGMLTTLFISVVVFMKFQGKDSWLKSIIVAFGGTLFLFLVFSYFLRVPIPKGPLGF